MLFTLSCRRETGASSTAPSNNQSTLFVDPAIQDTVIRQIKLRTNRHFASFETPAEIRFFADGLVIDSIIESDFHMISWYSVSKDTIDLVAHIADFETEALLVRFLHGTTSVYYLRAPHEGQKYFRLASTDPYSDYVEVPPVHYHLRLSAIPDSVKNPLVFGSIDMESGTYFDQRDSLKRRKIQMKFYFCSKFRHFDYPE